MPPTNSTRNWVHSDRQPSFSKQTALLLPAVNQRQYRVCRKRLSRTDHLVVYDGDGTASRPLLSVRHHPSLRSSSKTLAHVTPLGSATAEYVVEGSYGRGACAVRDARCGDAVVAEVSRRRQIGAAAQDLGARGRSRRKNQRRKGRSGGPMPCVFLRTGRTGGQFFGC